VAASPFARGKGDTMSSTTLEHAPKLLLSAIEASKALSVCPRTLWGLTHPRGPIPAVRCGTRVLYPVDGLRRWIDAQTATTEGRAEG
jgi:hypothetical protein